MGLRDHEEPQMIGLIQMIDMIGLIFYNNFIGGNELPFLLQMQFWTPERCKTIETMQLMDNSLEMSAQAVITKNPARKAQLMANVEMIQAELRTRF